MNGFRTRWIAVRESFWFVPGAAVLGLAVLAVVLVRIDRHLRFDSGLDLVFGGDASAARDILAAVAASLVTVAGVTLSLTIVTFQLVAGQYSPRAVRSLVQDRTIQLTAGVFVGVVAYCLIVLRDVRSSNGVAEFVPRLSVSMAIVLALAALALLIVFIHHLASTIRVENIAADVARETLGALDDLYPERVGAAADERDERDEPGEHDGTAAHSSRPGFVQTIEIDSFASRLDAGSRLDLHVTAGDFVTEGMRLATLRPAPDDPAAFERAIQKCVAVTSERTIEQDAAFGLRQLADIALRAISPSLNDPTTAITCVGYYGACLERLAERALPGRERRVGEVTVVVRRRSFAEHVGPLIEISRYASGDARVAAALLEALSRAARAAAAAGARDRIATLVAAAEAIAEPALADARTDHDRELVRRALDGVQQQV